jgi:hypothetical protein
MAVGANDKEVNPQRVRDLYSDFGSAQKIFVDLFLSQRNVGEEPPPVVHSIAGMADARIRAGKTGRIVSAGILSASAQPGVTLQDLLQIL